MFDSESVAVCYSVSFTVKVAPEERELPEGRAQRSNKEIAMHDVEPNEDHDDSIGIFWWLIAAAIPPLGFLMGLTEFAANKVGPGIALWTVALIGALCWSAIA